MKIKIKVGYTQGDRGPGGSGYSSFDGWYSGAKQDPVIEFEVETEKPLDPKQVADMVYVADNAPYDLGSGVAAKIREALQAGPIHHSLSVGDTVEVDGVPLAVADMGFESLAQADAHTRAKMVRFGIAV